ncbi:3-hydroxyacyl-CoA dehydrogenase [Streptomyces sp. TE5632]
MSTEAYVYDAIRTPRGRGKADGALHGTKPIDLVVGLIHETLHRFPDLDPAAIDDIVLGVVSPVGDQGADIARTAAVLAGLPETVAGVQENRFCASGLEAVNLAAAKVRSGWEDLVLAGGVESMSRVPMGSDGGAWALDPRTSHATGFVPQGIGADLIATLEGFSRHDVDSYATLSQERAAAAWKDGRFDRSVVPMRDRNGRLVLDRDEHMRPGTTADSLAGLKPSFADIGELGGCDAVIEAVFEDTDVKHKVFQETQQVVAPDALLCSNTSTLPVTGLAKGVERPRDFIGLHFFSPVDRMRLVEIVKGEKTGEEALARAFDLVRQIRKTPIVVNDSRGFFTSRVIGRFIDEGVAMVGEGVEPASVEQAAAQAGYPAKVLGLMDELTLTLPRKIREETRRAVEASGRSWEPHPADAVVDRMIDEFGRPGRSGGAGFYDYVDGRRAGLWPGLREHFTDPAKQPADLTELMERMLFVEALDAVRCLEEGVLVSVADANIGSLLGIGFPPWTGGVLQYINGYDGGAGGGTGLPGFVARAREPADRHGERFTPPELLLRKAEQGETFTDS